MKYFFILILMMIFVACEPNPSGEGINLPPIQMGLKINPDTAFIQLGDTIFMKSSVSSNLNNGIKIEDGQAKINMYFGFVNQTPVSTYSFEEVENENQSKMFVIKGGIEYMTNENKILNIYALPYGDSIQVEIAFVPLKVGTYSFQVQSMFYEGSKGKTRIYPKFVMPNHHFDELRHDGPAVLPGEYGYDSRYNFAVYE